VDNINAGRVGTADLRVEDENSPAEKGAQVLDYLYGDYGWATEIELRELDMRIQERCVLGQLYGHYWTGAQYVREEAGLPTLYAPDYGFDVESIQNEGELSRGRRYDSLTKEWTRIILERRKQWYRRHASLTS
jgi:hypothetical protein